MMNRTARLNRWGLLALPLFVFLVVFFAYPTYEILRRSVSDFGPTDHGLLANYKWFFSTDVNIIVLERTFVVAVVVSALCLVFGYPYTYLMTVVSPRTRASLLGVVVISGFTSYMVRNYAWLVILQDKGPLNDLLAAMGIGRISFVGNLSGVYIALTQILMPLMILPLYATMRGIDRRLLLAAQGLGARPGRAFWSVYFRLSLPGVMTGLLLVFILTLGFYITPALIGSPSHALYSQLMYIQISQLLAWGHVGAMSVVLLALTFVILLVATVVARRVQTPGQSGGDLGLIDADSRQRFTLGRAALSGLGVIVAAWLVVPMLIVIPQSFTGQRTLTFPPASWSTHWYSNLFVDPTWRGSIVTSLEVAGVVAVLATLIGTVAAFGLVRGRFPGRAAMMGFVTAPMIVPLIVFAVGTYAVFLNWKLVGKFQGFVLAHLALAVPFVVVTVSAGLRTFDERLEDAAMNLGANRIKSLFGVTVPLLLPSILTGALFAFLTSLDEIVSSLFLSSPQVTTLPVQMYSSVVRDVDPTMAAGATVILILTLTLMLAAAFAQKLRRRLV